MQDRNLFEKLVDVSPGMEIWWDSSPIIFDNWCKKLLAKAAATDRKRLQAQFDRMFDPASRRRSFSEALPQTHRSLFRQFRTIFHAGKKRPRK